MKSLFGLFSKNKGDKKADNKTYNALGSQVKSTPNK